MKPVHVLKESEKQKRGPKTQPTVYKSKSYKQGRRFHFEFVDHDEKDIKRILQFLPMPEELDPPSPLSICEEVNEEPDKVHYIER